MEKKSTKKDEVTTRSEQFSAIIRQGKDGNNIVAVLSNVYYTNQINKYKPGTKVTLEIHTRKPKRTENQNRYYWGVYLPLISAETGERDLQALHELFKGKFLTEEIVEVLGNKVRKKKSTTELGVAEFCKYILDIEEMTGVLAPPTENYDIKPLRV